MSMPDLDLEQFKVGSLPTLLYIPDFLPKVQQDSLEQKITSAKAQWTQVVAGSLCITKETLTVMLRMGLLEASCQCCYLLAGSVVMSSPGSSECCSKPMSSFRHRSTPVRPAGVWQAPAELWGCGAREVGRSHPGTPARLDAVPPGHHSAADWRV